MLLSLVDLDGEFEGAEHLEHTKEWLAGVAEVLVTWQRVAEEDVQFLDVGLKE